MKYAKSSYTPVSPLTSGDRWKVIEMVLEAQASYDAAAKALENMRVHLLRSQMLLNGKL